MKKSAMEPHKKKNQMHYCTFRKLCLLLTLIPLLSNGAKNRPNVVFLLSDDQSAYSLGCYGNPDIKSPNVDRLAEDGMVFDNHYDTTAICMASRASVMTGMFEYKHGTNFSHGDMMLDTWKKTYPILLREAGYQTAFAGKFGFDLRESPKGKRLPLPEKDFDKWGGGPGQTNYATAKNASMKQYAKKYPHSTRSYGAFGRDFIRSSTQSDQPFCLSISFKAPHKPATPDPVDNHVYQGKTFRKPANYGRKYGEHFSKQSKQDRQYERFHSWNYSDKYDEVMAIYHQQIYAIDFAVGMIRDALKETGSDKNTVIIYTSDNGFFCGSHGYGSKVLPYEESSRVPLVVYDPRNQNSGKKLRTNALTGNVDFAPTILALAGLPVPENMDGKNLMEVYDDPKSSLHTSLPLINVWGKNPTHALGVVTEKSKYLHWGYAADGFQVTEELYDLEKDPLELTNEVNNPKHDKTIKRMRRLYDQRLTHWRKESVPYNDYQRFGLLFDRTKSWSERQAILKSLPSTKTKKPRKQK
jgi:arylsulfatase A-like enzyme